METSKRCAQPRVLLVVANHLWPTRLTGGFVGVDVFFVISGFLITAHLLSEIRRSDRVSLPRFYARRARRLLPAALLVGVVTLIATLVWLPAERWERIAREVFASAAYFENWMLTASSVNYSDRGQAATPAQHYWSLSVEEQFYLLWPLTLVLLGWLLARRFPGRIASRPALLSAVLLALAATSFAFAVWQTATNPAAAYFNTFGRVWEFMVRRPRRRLRRPRSACGSNAVNSSRYAASRNSPIRTDLRAALAVQRRDGVPWPLGGCPRSRDCARHCCRPGDAPVDTGPRLADWRPVRYLGDISYSLYLWHWPIIVIVPFVLAREVRSADRFVMLALSIVLAILTKHFVEDPGRTRLFATARPRRTLFATLASVGMVGVLAAGTIFAAGAIEAREAARIEAAIGSGCFAAEALEPGNDCANPFGPALFPAGGESEAPWKAAAAECTTAPTDRQILAEGKPSYVECDFNRGSGAVAEQPYKVWLIGDSHAEHWKAAANDLARGNGWDVKYTIQGGCPSVTTPLVRAFGAATTSAKQDACAAWMTEVSERILADSPDLVLVSNFASTEEVDDGSNRPQVEQLSDGMKATLRAWAAAGSEVVVIRDVPTAGAALGPDCVAQTSATDRACVLPRDEALPADPMFDAAKALPDPRISVIDLTPNFCTADECSGVIGAVPVFFDSDHMSATFSRSLAPMLGTQLSDVLGIDLKAPRSAAG